MACASVIVNNLLISKFTYVLTQVSDALRLDAHLPMRQ